MVPVNKKIIAAKAPEAAEPQKRRPRNTELNSSKRKTGQQALAELRNQKLNCSASRIPDELKPYYQEITPDEFAKTVGADPDTLPGIISDIENEYGEKIVGYITCKPEYEEAFVDANIDSGFITESGKVLNGVDEGYINSIEVDYAAAHVDDPDLNSSEEPDSVNPSEKDAESLNSGDMNCSEGSGERWKTPEEYQEALDESRKAIEDGDNFHKFSVAVDKDGFGSIWAYVYTPSDKPGVCVSVEPDGDGTMIFSRKTAVDINLDDLESVTADLINQAKEELGGASGVDSSKKQDMNCSEGESDTIYTESGNQVAITDIKVVQNPETNALALFVPENGDDEIPEGFTVIGDVIATASGAPAIEENAETGDDSLNSSKKPPMNRAQRRAAQRGARRPKKR